MILRGSEIMVRPHEERDIDALHEAVMESTAEISRWLPWCHPALSKAELAGFIGAGRSGWKDRTQFQFAILHAATGAFTGGISLSHVVWSNRLANMGYWVRTSATRSGVASAAVRLVARYGFDHLGLSRIEIAAMPENVASCRVAERAGARFEGLARNRLVMHGHPFDARLYSLIPADVAG